VTTQQIKVPDLGGASQVEVIEICITKGDDISEGQSIVVVESDKASMDIPSPVSGTVAAIIVNEGAEVAEGDVLIEVTQKAEPELDQAEVPAADKSVSNDTAIVNGSADPQPIAATPAPSAAGQTIDVFIPDLGGAEQVELIEISVAVGDNVAEGDGLVVVESDKASMDIPSPTHGTIKTIELAAGATVCEGDLLARIEQANGTVTDTEIVEPVQKVIETASVNPTVSADQNTASSQAAQKPENIAKATSADDKKISSYAGPAVRKLARELGVELKEVKSSGPRGRLTKENIYDYVKRVVNRSPQEASSSVAGITPIPDIDFSKFGDVDIQPMTKMHKLTAANMQRSWLNVPHVTQFDDADITALEEFRQSLKPEMAKRELKISPLPFIIKAISCALESYPVFNSSLAADGNNVVYKKYIHIGMAVDTPAGLLVPVIRNADKKGIWELSQEIIELAEKAKARKLSAADMQGGCFTVSSLGGIGGRGFTPIINAPEVGILGVSKLSTQPLFVNGEFVARKMLPLALSYDHRAVNGGDAGRFLTLIVELLADVRRLML
jgi:pyruvate dehydrogenase E2 component (dihydrolipoamide acetyltransferase)